MTPEAGLPALNLASAAFAIAAVAFFAGKHPLETAFGLGAAAGVMATSVLAFGPLCGALVALVLGMATASMLVLVLAPHGRLRLPVAVLGTLTGVLCLATSFLPATAMAS